MGSMAGIQSVPGNVEKLHRDYEILNEYVSEKIQPFPGNDPGAGSYKRAIAQLAEFDVKGLIKEVRREFTQRKKEKLFILTRQMADEYIVRSDGILRGRAKSTGPKENQVWTVLCGVGKNQKTYHMKN